MRNRSSSSKEVIEIDYNDDYWERLKKLRTKALNLMKKLRSHNIHTVVYGSIARGDVKTGSDIDVFVTTPISSIHVEWALEEFKIKPLRRIVIQATPFYAPKGYFEIEESVSISLPLVKLRKVEREFYKFAGEISIDDLDLQKRVAGVDKRLMLIEPRAYGHIESNIIGYEAYVSKILGISMETVLERVRVLTKRRKTGRTGRFIEIEISKDENFESIIKKIADKNFSLRKRVKLNK
jgi:predicted nucleotidyltransferase